MLITWNWLQVINFWPSNQTILKRLKYISILLKLLITIQILSFLNIHMQTGYDTVNAIWDFIYKPVSEFILFTISSCLGIFLLIVSSFTKNKWSFLFGIIGVCLLLLSLFSLHLTYWDLQRENLINPQYLFILTTASTLTLNIYEHNLRRTKFKMQNKWWHNF